MLTGRPVTVACILDSFSMESFAPEADFLPLSFANWRTQLDETLPDLLLVESAWHGNEGQWRLSGHRKYRDHIWELQALIAACRQRDIPTVFWNKEDPISYTAFLSVARLFDVIFTTDADCISRYQRDCDNPNVYVLSFAAQPRLHHPAKTQPTTRRQNICFAGTWYAEGYGQRAAQLATLLDAALPLGLDIYDRNASGAQQKNIYPQQYKPVIKPPVAYSETSDLYRRYRIGLNANSVETSPTMFSRRVVEILACGTVVVSTPSRAIANAFPNIVPQVSTQAEAEALFSTMLEDNDARQRLAHQGYREVMRHHTVAHRFATILQIVGFDASVPAEPNVLCVALVSTRDEIDAIGEMFQQQAYANKELLFLIKDPQLAEALAESGASDIAWWKDMALGAFIQQIAAMPKIDAISIWCAQDYYAPFYLTDLVLPLKYTAADVIGKAAVYDYQPGYGAILTAPGLSHCDASELIANTLLLTRNAISKRLNNLENNDQQVSAETIYRAVKTLRLKLYSSDAYNYLRCVINEMPHAEAKDAVTV